MEDADIDSFMQWFQSNGGYVDTKSMGITEFPDSGRGAIALCDIPEGYTLFTLPRSITLSTRTSPLPYLFGPDAWRTHRLHKGWVGLILCMMWEDAWAHELDVMDGRLDKPDVQTSWGPYMRTLPTAFDTPMFWNAEELEGLEGTAVMGKIGRDDAERAYSEQLVPAIKTSPVLFPPSHHGKWYTLDAYHCAGSRILSRSFTVSRWTDDDEVEDDKDPSDAEGEQADDTDEPKNSHQNTSTESSMQIDDADSRPPLPSHTIDGLDSDSDSGEDDPSDVAMVPMADILNARWGCENAKLYYEPLTLRMVSTKRIKQGEQIFNTYGDPPNSDLLRRYGHTDLVPLSPSSVSTPHRHGDVEMKEGDTHMEAIARLGNPSDVAEIQADLVARVIQTNDFGLKAEDARPRIDWWLDEGEDDTFVLRLLEPGSHLSTIFPPPLVSFIRLLVLTESDFNNARSRGRLPKGNIKKINEKDLKKVLEILDKVFEEREGMYVGGSVEDDERLLSASETLSKRKRHVVIVRLGEKRILREARQAIGVMFAELSTTGVDRAGRRYESDTSNGRPGGNENRGTGGHEKRVVSTVEVDRVWKKARKG